jgi:hypothetical protein
MNMVNLDADQMIALIEHGRENGTLDNAVKLSIDWIRQAGKAIAHDKETLRLVHEKCYEEIGQVMPGPVQRFADSIIAIIERSQP